MSDVLDAVHDAADAVLPDAVQWTAGASPDGLSVSAFWSDDMGKPYESTLRLSATQAARLDFVSEAVGRWAESVARSVKELSDA